MTSSKLKGNLNTENRPSSLRLSRPDFTKSHMIYLIRHGLSEANVKGVFAGQKDDSVLVEQGIEEARGAGKKVLEMKLNVQRIVSSPSRRTKRTGGEVAEVIGFDKSKIIYDARIIEYDMGVLTGTPHHRVDSLTLISAEGAENVFDFRDRILGCVRDYIVLPGDTLFISHGGVGRMLETIKEGKEPELFYDTPLWANASITPIDWIQ